MSTVRQSLCQQITKTCARIDRRLGNRPGTAEKGLWFWLWPPHPDTDTDVLINLHADAVDFLHNITHTLKDNHD